MSGVNFSIPYKGRNVLTSKTQQLLNYQSQLPKITQELYKILKEKQKYRNKSKAYINEEINKLTDAVSFSKNSSNKILKDVQEKTAKTESSTIFNLISARKILIDRIVDLESNIYPVLEYLENSNQRHSSNAEQNYNNSSYIKPKPKPKSASKSVNMSQQHLEKKKTEAMRHSKQKKQTKAMRQLDPKSGINTNQFTEQSEPNNEQGSQNSQSNGNGYENGNGNRNGNGNISNGYNQPMMFQTMRGPVWLSGQEARNANNGIFRRNYEEEYRQRKMQLEYERQHDPEFLRHLELERQRQEYQRQHDPEYQRQLQLEHQKQRRQAYRQRLRQKRQQEAEINTNNNFEDNSTDFGSIRAERSKTAKSKRSGLELERL